MCLQNAFLELNISDSKHIAAFIWFKTPELGELDILVDALVSKPDML